MAIEGNIRLPGHALEVPLPNPYGNECFGCGPANHSGLRMEFFASEEIPGHVFCRIMLANAFEGPPGHAHGGIVATLLDEAMGKANSVAKVVAMTRTMEIQFLRPVPLEKEILVEGWNDRRDGRKNFNAARITNANREVLATATGLFISVDRDKVLAALADR